MKKNFGIVLMSLAVLAAAARAEGQSLGDAARREAERRSKLNAPTKVYTTADLDAIPARGTVPASAITAATVLAAASDAAAPAATSADAKDKQAEPAKVRVKRDEEHWRERAKVIRDRLERLKSDAAAIEGRIGTVRLELESASGSKAAALSTELEQATPVLTRIQNELRLIEDEWKKFEERARVAKIPEAWIR